jgi:transcriptional regulator with GAF, ATPase, and Fis domain
MSTLLVIQGPNVGVKHRLGKVTSIGRAPENTIQLADSKSSRFHCEIRRQGRAYTIYDRDSRNGVHVNGAPVTEKLLRKNDEIAIGSSVFSYDSDYDLKNTSFSNKLVYFSSPDAETIYSSDIKSADLKPASPDEAKALEALQSMARLFAADGTEFPVKLQAALESMKRLFNAAAGCIMLWDEVLKELQPIVTSADVEELTVSNQILKDVLHQKQAILTSNIVLDSRQGMNAVNDEKNSSVICVPLLAGEDVSGVLYLALENLNECRLEDIRVLQSVAGLAGAAIRNAQKSVLSFEEPEETPPSPVLIGASPSFQMALDLVDRVAPHDSSVLLVGETGTGKELIARTIHNRSPRAKYPFVALNCAAIPESLVESELFGHERGAFTGAVRLAIGKVEAAHGGTLFLDEIGEMSISVQPKLLRFLQEMVFYRVGGTKPVQVDVRVIAATNRNLRQAVADKTFREDLLYRLNVVTIESPPIRARREDIRLLVEHFLRKHARALNKNIFGITDSAMVALEKYHWPGNVRELENCIERAVLLSSSGIIGPDRFTMDFAFDRASGETASEATRPLPGTRPEESALSLESLSLKEMEKKLIRRALSNCGGNQVKAAQLLEIHRNTIRKKIQEYEIDLSEFDRKES